MGLFSNLPPALTMGGTAYRILSAVVLGVGARLAGDLGEFLPVLPARIGGGSEAGEREGQGVGFGNRPRCAAEDGDGGAGQDGGCGDGGCGDG